MLIERVSGEDYYDYMARHVYRTAGMTGAGHFAVDSLPPGAAIGCTRAGPDADPGARSPPTPPICPVGEARRAAGTPRPVISCGSFRRSGSGEFLYVLRHGFAGAFASAAATSLSACWLSGFDMKSRS